MKVIERLTVVCNVFSRTSSFQKPSLIAELRKIQLKKKRLAFLILLLFLIMTTFSPPQITTLSRSATKNTIFKHHNFKGAKILNINKKGEGIGVLLHNLVDNAIPC